MKRCKLLLLFLLVLSIQAYADRPNVLMIIVDDLNHWVGHLERNPDIKTPHIDALAARGVSFKYAYTASSQCNPSRAATFVGRRPTTTGVYANSNKWEGLISQKQLLTTHIHNQGYYVAGAGKVHGSVTSKPYVGIDNYQKRGAEEKGKVLDKGVVAAQSWSILQGGDEVAEDEKTVRFIVDELSKQHKKPFFLLAGLYKPHLKWSVPKKYYDMYPLDKIKLPPVKADDYNDLDRNAVRAIAGDRTETDKIAKDKLKQMVRAYMAAVSYADAQVGRIMKALDNSSHRDNTIVVLWGDHGYHLGEKHIAAKRALWEESTRTPYIWLAPGVTPKGVITNNTVDLMTVFPTLCDLLNIPVPTYVEGESISKILRNPLKEFNTHALTTYRPGNHTIRTPDWRYIRYANGFEELYDKRKDEYEWHNLAALAKYDNIKKKLKALLPKKEKENIKAK